MFKFLVVQSAKVPSVVRLFQKAILLAVARLSLAKLPLKVIALFLNLVRPLLELVLETLVVVLLLSKAKVLPSVLSKNVEPVVRLRLPLAIRSFEIKLLIIFVNNDKIKIDM